VRDAARDATEASRSTSSPLDVFLKLFAVVSFGESLIFCREGVPGPFLGDAGMLAQPDRWRF
jgi:hypothetical protein